VTLVAAADPEEKKPEEVPRETSQGRAADGLGAGILQTLDALADALHSPDVATRRSAIHVLEVLGAAALPKVDAVTAALGDEDKFVRWAAARTLGALARDDGDRPKLPDGQAEAAARGLAD